MSGLVEAVLAQFPAHAYPLVLASDPDDLLAEEEVLAALGAWGYRLLREADPVRLRHRLEQMRPFSVEEPLLVITAEPLNALPYDLWQPGHRVELALHTFFPRLAYPVARQLSPAQRLAASRAPEPDRVLGVRTTTEYLLRVVFDADPARLAEPAALVAWLNTYHQRGDPMSAELGAVLLDALRGSSVYGDWPLEELLADAEAFAAFVSGQWEAYLSRATGRPIHETDAPYLLPFGEDEGLQDAVPALVRTGALTPARVPDMGRLPAWARPAVEVGDGQTAARRAETLLEALSEEMASPASLRWEGWQRVARLWAELDGIFHSPATAGEVRPTLEAQRSRRDQVQAELDAAFVPWLRERYAPLAVRRLPQPHHVHHLPDYIAHHRELGRWQRVALLVLDGLSLADWLVVGGAWRTRHREWRFREQLLLAQIPTVTAISRQALVSGQRPAEFADTLHQNSAEARQWASFWARQDVVGPACAYLRLALDREDAPVTMDDTRLQALCLIDHSIDELLHGESLGAVGVQASLRIWLEGYSRRLEAVIDHLLGDGFAVFVCSDHGHVEARGMGQPSEGLAVESRSQRARLYRDPHAARRAHEAFAETLLWTNDGLLPDDVQVLLPLGRRAFATYNDAVVTHGGATLEEVVVPLVTITQG